MTMIDTNIVIDLREEASRWFPWSLDAVASVPRGELAASVIVLGELATRGGALADLEVMIVGFGVRLVALDASASFYAGRAQHAYRRGGGTREKLLADFLIGGHAIAAGTPLITRDPAPYRRFFPELTLIAPDTHP